MLTHHTLECAKSRSMVCDPVGSFAFFLGSREVLIKILIISSIFYISYMEPLFVVAKIIRSPVLENMIAYFFIQNCFKCDYDHYSAVAFGNSRITL